MTTEDLRNAYEELVDVMELVDDDDKPLEVPEDADDGYLLGKIKECIEMVDPETDKFSDAAQDILDAVEDGEEPKEEKPKAEAKEKPKGKTKEGKKVIEKAGKPGKPGIIASIVECIEGSGKKGITKEEILNVLIERFSDREPQSMKSTINVQVPTRISKEKFEVKALDGGRYAKA